MEIFNVQIFGEDAKEWLEIPKSQKKEWILKYTNQLDDLVIEEFLLNPKITKDVHCLDCRNKKEKITISEIVENKTSVIEEVVATDENPIGAKFKKSKRR